MHGEGITNYSKNIYISILEFTVYSYIDVIITSMQVDYYFQ